MPTFTDRAVRGLKGEDREREVMDSSNRGFGVRVSPSGARTFIYRYRINGKLSRMALGKFPGTSLADARDLYRKAKERNEDGYDPRGGSVNTVKDLSDLYIKLHAKPKKKTWERDRALLDTKVLPAWGNKRPDQIRKRDVILLLDGIVASGAPVQANRVLSLVRKMFNFAVDRDLLDANPAWRVKAPSAETSKNRVLSDDEITELLNQRQSQVKDALVVILLTGARPGEVAAMRWEDIDGSTWTLPTSKNKRPVVRPLLPVVMDINEGMESYNEYAFSSHGGEGHIRPDSLVTWVNRRKWSWSPHDVRRTCATRVAGLGASRGERGRHPRGDRLRARGRW